MILIIAGQGMDRSPRIVLRKGIAAVTAGAQLFVFEMCSDTLRPCGIAAAVELLTFLVRWQVGAGLAWARVRAGRERRIGATRIGRHSQ